MFPLRFVQMSRVLPMAVELFIVHENITDVCKSLAVGCCTARAGLIPLTRSIVPIIANFLPSYGHRDKLLFLRLVLHRSWCWRGLAPPLVAGLGSVWLQVSRNRCNLIYSDLGINIIRYIVV